MEDLTSAIVLQYDARLEACLEDECRCEKKSEFDPNVIADGSMCLDLLSSKDPSLLTLDSHFT